jgi:hypothetical protein
MFNRQSTYDESGHLVNRMHPSPSRKATSIDGRSTSFIPENFNECRSLSVARRQMEEEAAAQDKFIEVICEFLDDVVGSDPACQVTLIFAGDDDLNRAETD